MGSEHPFPHKNLKFQWTIYRGATDIDLFKAVGTHCAEIIKVASKLRLLILELRRRKYTLIPKDEFDQAVEWIGSGPGSQLDPDVVRKYTRALKSWLAIDEKLIPPNPLLTGTLPQYIGKGEEMDCIISGKWWHCVVTKDLQKGAKVCEVYRVGFPPCIVGSKLVFRRTSLAPSEPSEANRNPATVPRDHVRSHIHGQSVSGRNSEYSVDWIKAKYCNIDEDDAPDLEGKGTGSLGSLDVAAIALASTKTDASKQGQTEPKKGKPNKNSKKRKRGTRDKAKNSTLGSNINEGEESECSVDHRRRDRLSQTNSSSEEVCSFDWLAPFLQCDKIIQDLELLETKPALQLDNSFFCHYLEVLKRLRSGQGAMYQAGQKFQEYFELQSRALETYVCRSVEHDAAKTNQFIKDMNESLRASYKNAFTKNEIVVISCLLADPGLSFCNIRQKTRKSISDGATRGMAFVPVQLERFFQERLRKLGVINDMHHPRHMEALSAVVLSSTYCYHQLGTWKYRNIWKSKSGHALKLANFPLFLSINGIYAPVDHTFSNGRMGASYELYAQVQSGKTCLALGIETAEAGRFSKTYARCIVLDSSQVPVQASVYVFVSLGECQAIDPIHIARFTMDVVDVEGVQGLRVGSPEMFANLDCVGEPVYQKMFSHVGEGCSLTYQEVGGSCPTINFLDVEIEAGVDMEYGPDLYLSRVPAPAGFKPNPLMEQASHCDGNFYDVKDKWLYDSTVGKYRVTHHVPLVKESETEVRGKVEPLFLLGKPHLNSMSFLMGVNANTTLTFPASSRHKGNVVQDTPFGGFESFAFVEPHLGSQYGLDANERPHLYAHCQDLRQFPVSDFGNLFAVLAAKQRIEALRQHKQSTRRCENQCHQTLLLSTGTFRGRSLHLELLEHGLKHFVFDQLTTNTYKTKDQDEMLQQVRQACLSQEGES
jgi:hypothetical protein